ncbi:MAG: thioether cross-link-forming SCIFF peptide maturase, partial [Clostridia bacterium]|nr:thioether cross-link-forming SCIFF peptide maturase [Clostridia bacterium]
MIHQYKLNGYNIVIDVYSGSVHLVDEVAYDIIEAYERCTSSEITKMICEKYSDEGVTAEDVADCISDIEELKAAGRLFTEDKYKDHAFDFKNRHTDVKALCLH